MRRGVYQQESRPRLRDAIRAVAWRADCEEAGRPRRGVAGALCSSTGVELWAPAVMLLVRVHAGRLRRIMTGAGAQFSNQFIAAAYNCAALPKRRMRSSLRARQYRKSLNVARPRRRRESTPARTSSGFLLICRRIALAFMCTPTQPIVIGRGARATAGRVGVGTPGVAEHARHGGNNTHDCLETIMQTNERILLSLHLSILCHARASRWLHHRCMLPCRTSHRIFARKTGRTGMTRPPAIYGGSRSEGAKYGVGFGVSRLGDCDLIYQQSLRSCGRSSTAFSAALVCVFRAVSLISPNNEHEDGPTNRNGRFDGDGAAPRCASAARQRDNQPARKLASNRAAGLSLP